MKKYLLGLLLTLATYSTGPYSQTFSYRSKISSLPKLRTFPLVDSIPKSVRNLKNNSNYIIAIDKSEQKMNIYDNELKLIEKYLVSTGLNIGDKQKKGDKKTPEGIFSIKNIQYSADWKYNGRKAYGPYFVRLDTKWDGIGIHGTDEEWKLGERASRGCIRTANKNIIEIKRKYSNSLVIIRDSLEYYTRMPYSIDELVKKSMEKILEYQNNNDLIPQKYVKIPKKIDSFRNNKRFFGKRKNKH